MQTMPQGKSYSNIDILVQSARTISPSVNLNMVCKQLPKMQVVHTLYQRRLAQTAGACAVVLLNLQMEHHLAGLLLLVNSKVDSRTPLFAIITMALKRKMLE